MDTAEYIEPDQAVLTGKWLGARVYWLVDHLYKFHQFTGVVVWLPSDDGVLMATKRLTTNQRMARGAVAIHRAVKACNGSQ